MLKLHDLRPGDVIYSVDGVEADPSVWDCLVYLRLNVSAGDEVDLGVLRDGVRTPMTAPDPPPALPQARSPLNDQAGSAIRAPRISRMSPGRVRQQPPIAVAPSRRHSRASSGRSAVSGGISQTFRTGSQRPSPFG